MIISGCNSYLYASRESSNDRKCSCAHVGGECISVTYFSFVIKKDLRDKTEIFKLVVLTYLYDNFGLKFIFICIQKVLKQCSNDRKCSCVHVGGYCISVSYFSFVREGGSGKQI